MTAGTSRVVFATDLHLADGHGGFEAFAADLEEIADLAPDLLVLGGDICLLGRPASGPAARLARRHHESAGQP